MPPSLLVSPIGPRERKCLLMTDFGQQRELLVALSSFESSFRTENRSGENLELRIDISKGKAVTTDI